MQLRVKERIMMLRLMEKLRQHPDFAVRLGVEVNGAGNDLYRQTEPKALPMREAPSGY